MNDRQRNSSRKMRPKYPPWRHQIAKVHDDLNLWIAGFTGFTALGICFGCMVIMVNAQSMAMQLLSLAIMAVTVAGALQIIIPGPNASQGADEIDEMVQRVEEMYEHTLTIDPRPHGAH